VGEERDAVRQRIDAATVTQAHLDRLADLRDEGMGLVTDAAPPMRCHPLGLLPMAADWAERCEAWATRTAACIAVFAPVDARLFGRQNRNVYRRRFGCAAASQRW
jgi:hypothetical protein